jgi:hypothetical protein
MADDPTQHPGPAAPWLLSGEVIVVFLPRPQLGEAAQLPPDLRPLPGPAILWAGHWAQTPVGPFSELAVAVPARLGLRVGLCITFSVVTNADARMAGRLGWGLPRQLGDLRWVAVGPRRRLEWWDREIEVTAEATRSSAPFATVLRALQRGADGPLIVPTRLRGWARRAEVLVKVEAGDGLEELAGPRKGWLVSGRQVVLQPSRAPSGVFRTRLIVPAPVAG